MNDSVTNRHLAAWRPPEGWICHPTSIEGVEAWGPPEVDDDAPDAPTSFSCPQCGALQAFDPTKGALHCASCGHSHTVDGVETIQMGEFTAASLAAAPRGWGTDRQALHCESCGSEVSVESGQLATSCPFCASNQVDLRAIPDDALRPQYVLPFGQPIEAAATSAKAWLGEGWKHPSGLAKMAKVDRFAGVYMPWWIFDATMHAHWKCEVGITTTESYTDSNGRRQTRTVTRWHWETGETTRAFTWVRVPGSNKVPGIERVGDYPYDTLKPYDPSLLAGFGAQAYNISLPDAWDLGRQDMREMLASACKSAAGGDRQRNLSLDANMNDEVWMYSLLPAYVSAYTFAGRTWVVVVNGVTGEVGGQRPVAWWKIYGAIAAMLTPGLFTLVCLGLPLLVFGPVGMITLVFGFIFFVAGVLGSMAVFRSAQAEEQL